MKKPYVTTDDGHDPSTCTFNECLSESDVPCPFLRDVPPVLNRVELPTGCVHDWRQFWTGTWPGGFYCTRCLERHD
jgi:hypothetical protein